MIDPPGRSHRSRHSVATRQLSTARLDPALDSLPTEGPLLVTMGFVAPGIEMVVHAMALLAREHPDLQYVVAGRTHPELARRDGERYRWSLEALADDLGLHDRVRLLDGPLDLTLHESLTARCDVVVVPYRSGEHAAPHLTLEAGRARRPVIATRPCAILAGTAGDTITIDVDGDEACAAAIDHVLSRAMPSRLGGGSPLHHALLSR